MLTDIQKARAAQLLKERPTVLPGTRVILDAKKQADWFARVNAAMRELKVGTRDVSTFCDLAGVPD